MARPWHPFLTVVKTSQLNHRLLAPATAFNMFGGSRHMIFLGISALVVMFLVPLLDLETVWNVDFSKTKSFKITKLR